MTEAIVALIAFLGSSVHKNFPNDHHDYMFIQFSVAQAVLSIPIALYFAKRLGTWFGCFAAYLLIHSSSQILFYYGRYGASSPYQINAVAIDTCFATLLLLTFAFAVTELSPQWVQGVKGAIPVYAALNATYVIVVHLMGWKYGNSSGAQGALDYSGMNACLMAACAGFLIPKQDDKTSTAVMRIFWWAPVLFALYFSHSAMGWGVLALVLAARFRCLWILPIPLLIGYLAVGNKMFDSSFRFPAYKFFMGEFFHSRAIWFGTGVGTFKTHAPVMQTDLNFMPLPDGRHWGWFWLHSDVLQTVFELGIIGGILALGVLGLSLLMAVMWGDPEMLSLLLGCLGMAALNYPCRYAVSAFLFAFAVIEPLRVPLGYAKELWGPGRSFSKDKKESETTHANG